MHTFYFFNHFDNFFRLPIDDTRNWWIYLKSWLLGVFVEQDASLVLKDELVFDRLAGFSLRTKYDSLKKDTAEVEAHVRQLIECLDSLNRLQQRYVNSFFISVFE